MKQMEDIYLSTLRHIEARYLDKLQKQRSLMGKTDFKQFMQSEQYDWELHWSIKEKTLHAFLNALYTNMTFDYKGISEYDFVNSYGYGYGDDYFSVDCLRATYKRMRFESVYVDSSIEDSDDYEDEDGEWHTDYYTRTIFRGEAIKLNVPFWYREYLHIYRGSSKMDHQAFSHTYGVICDDPIYSHYLLTQGFMDRLIQLKEYLGIAPSISFYEDMVTIYIPSAQKYPPIDFRRLDDVVWEYFFEVKLLIEVLAILKLEEHSIALDEGKLII